MTATPCTAEADTPPDPDDRQFVRDTLRFFELAEPTFRYTLREAISDGHLVPYRIYKAMTVKTAAEGGFLVARKELDWTAMDAAPRAELERLFEQSDPIIVDPRALERTVTVPERNRAIVREFRDAHEKGLMGKDGIRRWPAWGKTIVFAVTKRHAETLAAMLDEHFADPASRDTLRGFRGQRRRRRPDSGRERDHQALQRGGVPEDPGERQYAPHRL